MLLASINSGEGLADRLGLPALLPDIEICILMHSDPKSLSNIKIQKTGAQANAKGEIDARF
jgi:hypothetical protein